MTDYNNLEVLAPAGDFERFTAAMDYGADAVYLGAKKFGMRASPDNFDFDELKKAVCTAHAMGKKVYLFREIMKYPDSESLLKALRTVMLTLLSLLI